MKPLAAVGGHRASIALGAIVLLGALLSLASGTAAEGSTRLANGNVTPTAGRR
jgi:hypothetical protein